MGTDPIFLINSRLRLAYVRAEYAVFAAPELVIHIGEPSPRLDALLAAHGAHCAAYVSAANPRGWRRNALRNRIAFGSLKKLLRKEGLRFLAGEGRDPNGDWPAEASLLVLGISRAAAEALGRRLRQNAIVWIERGSPPELVALAARRAR